MESPNQAVGSWRRAFAAALVTTLALATTACGSSGNGASTGTPSTKTPTGVADRDVASGCWKASDRLKTTGGNNTVAGQQQWKQPPAMTINPKKRYQATLETNKGTFEVEFYPQDAPKTVNNFVCLARAGYYDGTPFHRIIANFVIQGGDPTGTGSGGPGYKFEDEPIKRNYEIGTLAMANAGPNTNGSQFFVITGPDGTRLPKNYTIFGKVVSGMDVVNAIASTPTKRSASGEQSVPTEPIVLQKVTISESETATPAANG